VCADLSARFRESPRVTVAVSLALSVSLLSPGVSLPDERQLNAVTDSEDDPRVDIKRADLSSQTPQLEVAAFLLLTYSVELDVGGGGSVVWHS